MPAGFSSGERLVFSVRSRFIQSVCARFGIGLLAMFLTSLKTPSAEEGETGPGAAQWVFVVTEGPGGAAEGRVFASTDVYLRRVGTGAGMGAGAWALISVVPGAVVGRCWEADRWPGADLEILAGESRRGLASTRSGSVNGC